MAYSCIYLHVIDPKDRCFQDFSRVTGLGVGVVTGLVASAGLICPLRLEPLRCLLSEKRKRIPGRAIMTKFTL